MCTDIITENSTVRQKQPKDFCYLKRWRIETKLFPLYSFQALHRWMINTVGTHWTALVWFNTAKGVSAFASRSNFLQQKDKCQSLTSTQGLDFRSALLWPCRPEFYWHTYLSDLPAEEASQAPSLSHIFQFRFVGTSADLLCEPKVTTKEQWNGQRS